MPLYEYACDSCGTVFEVLQKISDRPLRKCRNCSGRVRKLVSRTSFQLKGGGWYAQGYSKSGSDGSGGKSAGKSGKSADKSGKSADKAGKSGKSGKSSGEGGKSESKSQASSIAAATA